ncbi:MAG: pirin family protein [Methanomicrobiales archaeon]|nr:pirin family protein [Methanomicrobiales archaeon]
MPADKTILRRSTSPATREGAGVLLRRAFGYHDIPLFDPFLMLDDFRADWPEDYLAGFPWHPHRGIETVTYMLAGKIEHGDSMGHAGTVDAGAVQWMTAGSGIIHQEMPQPVDGMMGGFQLWVNLPKAHKMMDPRYQEIPADEVPVVTLPGGVTINIICGNVDGVAGPVKDLVAEPEYLDIALDPGARYSHPVRPGYMAAAYVFSGSAQFDERRGPQADHSMLLFGDEGVVVTARAGPEGVRFLFFSGKPLREPIAWGGPIVMNTEAELKQAFADYKNKTFIRKRAKPAGVPASG